MSQAFELLNKDLRQYIYQEGWQDLRPIQSVAIEQSLKNDHNFILSAPTASGKTEAAFLPALNSVENFYDGLKIIYISPLIALINDQFKRLFKLCSDLGIPITSWHGEANRSKKQELIKHPAGVLLITPESLEAMLALRPGEASHLFKMTEWIIVDELHAFLPNNRGVQLRSILERMKNYHQRQPRYVGMSASLNPADFIYAKAFFNSEKRTDVIVDTGKNSFTATIDYFKDSHPDSSEKILNRLFELSQVESMLVFPNTRSLVESLAVGLKRKASKQGSNAVYFAHHASLSRDARLEAENFAKEAEGRLFTICATSTLELGVDIGSVDSIVQYNAPFSASSLAQRLGRSGRKNGENRLHLMATEPWSLLQALACIELYRVKELERNVLVGKPFDVLAQQILALLMEYSGINIKQLMAINHHLQTFSKITDDEVKRLLEHLIAKEYIEIVGEEAIVGLATEKLLYKGEFYAHFKSEKNFSVYSSEKKIGELGITPNVQVGVNIFLAAKVWRIEEIISSSNKIRVSPAIDGRAPVYLGSSSEVSHLVRQKMANIVFADKTNWPKEIKEILNQIQAEHYAEDNFIFAESGENVLWRTFAGSKINQSLKLMLNLITASTDFKLDDYQTAIWGPELKQNLLRLRANPPDKIDIYDYLKHNPNLLTTMLSEMKYLDLLPTYLQLSYAINVCLDIDGSLAFLSREMSRS